MEIIYSTWIYRIAVNTSIDHLRRRKPTVEFRDIAVKKDSAADDVKDNIEQKERKEYLKTALVKLPLKQKNAIILKHFHGLKISQISKILGCSQSSVKTHLARAVTNIKKEIGGNNELH